MGRVPVLYPQGPMSGMMNRSVQTEVLCWIMTQWSIFVLGFEYAEFYNVHIFCILGFVYAAAMWT